MHAQLASTSPNAANAGINIRINCLVATALPITGTLIWLNKMKKRSMKQ